MDTTHALALLPAAVRRRVYIALGCVSSLLSGLGAFFLASPFSVPWWVGAGLAGVGVLAGPFAILAGGNVAPDPGRRVLVDDEGRPVYADEDPDVTPGPDVIRHTS